MNDDRETDAEEGYAAMGRMVMPQMRGKSMRLLEAADRPISGWGKEEKEMIGPGFADEIGKQLLRWIAVIAAVCFALGALLMWGIPKLWEIVKPWIHSATS